MRTTSVYPVITKALKREGVTLAKLASKIGISRESLSRKLSGKRDFTLEEASKLKEIIEPKKTIEEVFQKK